MVRYAVQSHVWGVHRAKHHSVITLVIPMKLDKKYTQILEEPTEVHWHLMRDSESHTANGILPHEVQSASGTASKRQHSIRCWRCFFVSMAAALPGGLLCHTHLID